MAMCISCFPVYLCVMTTNIETTLGYESTSRHSLNEERDWCIVASKHNPLLLPCDLFVFVTVQPHLTKQDLTVPVLTLIIVN